MKPLEKVRKLISFQKRLTEIQNELILLPFTTRVLNGAVLLALKELEDSISIALDQLDDSIYVDLAQRTKRENKSTPS